MALFQSEVLRCVFGPERLETRNGTSTVFTEYYKGDQIKEVEMGGACSILGKDAKFIQRFGRKARREDTFARSRRRWNYIIKMSLEN
jgi:hypothetical protein